MSAREWCDNCGVPTKFEPHETMAYTVVCTCCGHHRIERTRSLSPRKKDDHGGDPR